MRSAAVLIVVAALLTAACGSTPTGVATNPPLGSDAAGVTQAPSPTPGGPQTSGTRTVLSPLGLNVRSSPSSSSSSLGAAAQGTELTVLGYTADGGGWYQVKGATVTGYITADPTLSAAGHFVAYSSDSKGFGLLYPGDWTFAEETDDVMFRPQSGADSVLVRGAATVGALGAPGEPGYANAADTAVVVCGVTGDLLTYVQSGTASNTPFSSAAPLQKYLAQIHIKLDDTHALALEFNYTQQSDADIFGYFYNSIRFPFPQCEQ